MYLATQLSIGLSCSSPSEGRRATGDYFRAPSHYFRAPSHYFRATGNYLRATHNYALLLSDWTSRRLAPKTVSTAFKQKLSIVYALWEAPVDTGADAH